MLIKETYRAKMYSPELVTGCYVRVEGKKCNYQFKVFETATNSYGKVGVGFTLREYIIDGEELTNEFKEECIKTKTTKKLF